jgi:cytochrome c5
MVVRGADLKPEELETVVAYLTRAFGPAAGPIKSGPQDAAPLPDAPGKDLVQSRCGMCHDLGRVTATRRSREEWERTVESMLARLSNTVPADQKQAIATYLAAQFGIH